MRRIFFLLPCLFLGIKPYQQNIQVANKPDSISQLARDTLILNVVKANLDVQLSVSEQLELRKKKLKEELRKIKSEQSKIKRQQKCIKNDLDKYQNRGL